jgi:hypothetical protein
MAAEWEAVVLEHIRKLHDAWLALPPAGEARIAAIREDYMPLVNPLMQALNVQTALAEIALHDAAGVTGNDLEADRERVLKGYPGVLYALRFILPPRETDLFVGDLKAMGAGRAPLALYPLAKKYVDKRRHEIQERCVLRAEYDAGVLGISRKEMLERRNTASNPPLPVSRLNRWALHLPNKQLAHNIGEKKRDGVALSEEEQKLQEAIERNTLEQLIDLANVTGGQSGSRARSRRR